MASRKGTRGRSKGHDRKYAEPHVPSVSARFSKASSGYVSSTKSRGRNIPSVAMACHEKVGQCDFNGAFWPALKSKDL